MPGKRVIATIETDTLTNGDKLKDLDAVNLIKQKQYGTIKFRMCDYSSKKRICERRRECI